MPRIRTWLALLLAVAVVAAACGDDGDDGTATAADAIADEMAEESHDDDGGERHDDDGGEPDPGDEAEGSESADGAMAEDEGFPVTISSAAGEWTLQAPPQRVVSLSPTATEILFAIGAGDQVIAVDAFSNYPEEAPTTDLSGWDPNVEAIVAFGPDLVVIANDANDLVAALTELDIPVLISPAAADIESGYDLVGQLGIAVGQIDGAAATVATMRDEIDAALAKAPQAPLRIYHELDETYFSASSFGFIGAIYAAMGAENIADEADVDGFGFPQLTEEYIVDADPELIVITDQVSYTPDDVAARPGWDEVSAVVEGHIVVVNADIASRWGPRLPQFIDAVAEALAAATVEVG